MDLLKYRSFPDIARAIRQSAESVVTAWLRIAGDNVPVAEGLSQDKLRDHLALTLTEMAATIESDQPTTIQELLNTAMVHGDSRFAQNYNLSELLTEYSLIRPILIEHVTEEVKRPLETQEIVALNLAVDIAVKHGVLAFSNRQKAELQASSDSRAKYLSFLSHDLRGGLNGTLLMIEVLRRELKPHAQFAEAMEDLEAMRRSILDTVSTMDRFLHAEKLRNGKMQPRLGQVNLRTVVGDVVNQLSWTAKEKGVTIESSFVSGGEIINSDRELLLMVIQNLVSNAVKYCRGSVKVTAEGADGVEARIAVTDNGPGIADEHLARIFAPYSRGETHGQPGNGLGLYIARQSADLLQAKLWAESEIGKGSTFFIEIPQSK